MIYDIIVLKNLHFSPSTRKVEAGIFKISTLGTVFVNVLYKGIKG